MPFLTAATLFLGLSMGPMTAEPAVSAPVPSMVAADELGMELHRSHWRATPPVIQARVETLASAPPAWTVTASEPIIAAGSSAPALLLATLAQGH